MQRLSRSLSRFETQDIKTQPMNQPLFSYDLKLAMEKVVESSEGGDLIKTPFPHPLLPHHQQLLPIPIMSCLVSVVELLRLVCEGMG